MYDSAESSCRDLGPQPFGSQPNLWLIWCASLPDELLCTSNPNEQGFCVTCYLRQLQHLDFLNVRTSSNYESIEHALEQVREWQYDEDKQEENEASNAALEKDTAEKKKRLEQWSLTAYGEVPPYLSIVICLLFPY